MENENVMSVFVVVGGWDYEGESWDMSGKVFMNRKSAELYAESLRNGSNENEYAFHFVLIREVEVEG